MKKLSHMIIALLLYTVLFMSLYPSVFADMQGNMKLPDDTTIIGEEAFLNCTGMTSISIPVSVTHIGSRAFYGCSGLKDVYYGGTTAEWDNVAIDAYNGPLTRATIHCVLDYGTCGAEGNNLYWVLHEDGKLEILGSGAMADYSNGTAPWYNKRLSITSVTIESGVSSIGSSAFYNCSTLTALTIPEGVVSLGSSAFADCINLTKISIPASVTSIAAGAFEGCNGMKTAGPLDSNCNFRIGWAEQIPDNAFYSCRSLISIKIPVSVTRIGNSAFCECTGLKNVYYSGTADEWDDVAIEAGNDPLTRATIHCTQDYDGTFDREIEIVCPWGLGGGADSTIRPMATLLQNELGVPVEVRNVTGGSGVTGTTYAHNQLADGYTFLLGTQTLFIQDLMDNMDFNFKDEFECEDILVYSFNMLVGSKKQMDKYGIETFSELQEYVSSHPNEVSIARLVATGIDHMCFTAITKDQALNMKSYQGGNEVIADMVGGHVDLAVGGYDDLSNLIKSGDVIPLLVFCEHRIDTMPDCECTAELGIDCYAGPWRAIFAKKGTPQGAIDALIAAIEKCREDTTWKEFTRNAAYDQRVVPAPGEELQEFYLNEYKNLRDYMIDIQVLEKDYDDLA